MAQGHRAVRVFCAAGIGAGIALLLYLFLLGWERWTAAHLVPWWGLPAAQAVLFAVCRHGVRFLITKAEKP
jgi:hypothetical protein